MAKIKLSPLITEIGGKLGNVVFQRNPTGPFARNLVIPANPNTSAQQTARSRMTVRSKAWAGLTEGQRLAWNTAAASGDWTLTDSFGNEFNPTGEQLYIQLNINGETVGAGPYVTPPAKVTLPAVTIGTLTVNSIGPAVSQAYNGVLGANFTLVISATRPLSAGIMSPQESLFRHIGTSTAASPIDITALYTAKFGNPAAGQKIYSKLEVYSDNSGEVLNAGTTSAIVA